MWNKKNEKKKVSPIDHNALRRPGSYLLYQFLKKGFIIFLIIFTPIAIWVGAIVGILLSLFISFFYAFIISTIPIIVWGFLIRFYHKRIEESLNNLSLGYEGEVFIGEVLDSLKESGCKIIHDFTYTHRAGKSNIDHIIVAPQGVFTVETKMVSKIEGQKDEKIRYDGKTIKLTSGRTIDNPLNQAEAEAKALKDFIYKHRGKEISVQPIVVYPNWYIIDESPSNAKVYVWTHKYFANNIPKLPVILQEEDMISIYEALAEHNRHS